MKKIESLLLNPITIGVMLLLLIIICMAILAGFTNLRFKIGDFEFGAIRNNYDLINAIIEANNIPKNCENEQVSYMKDKDNQMIFIIMEHHAKLLKKHGVVENYFSHPQYFAYNHVVKCAIYVMEENAKIRFLYMFNHFNKYKIKEAKEYSKNTAIEYLNAVAEMIQKEWPGTIITKEENYEWTRQIVPTINEMLIDIFDHAFEIQLQFQCRIEELNKKYGVMR